jgi:hypothetical protein
MRPLLTLICVGLLFLSCKGKKEKSALSFDKVVYTQIEIPIFSEDSAYYFIEKQVSLGPRIPNSTEHKKAGDYLIQTLERFGANVFQQEFEQKNFSGQTLQLRNIIGSFFPDRKKRILLAAHWDTRPFADKDEKNSNASFQGANDGASGVGVLLEIARSIQQSGNFPDVGLDIIFFDGEDWGEGEFQNVSLPQNLDSWWCLGSQYWSNNKHAPHYSAYYGILLDMVGAKNSLFYQEGLSFSYAPKIVDKVWQIADQLGYGDIFIKQNQGAVIDDHKYVTEMAKIPMIDIVNYDPLSGSFGSFHHTTEDNLDLISKETLEAVGVTLLTVIYSEKDGI